MGVERHPSSKIRGTGRKPPRGDEPDDSSDASCTFARHPHIGFGNASGTATYKLPKDLQVVW